MLGQERRGYPGPEDLAELIHKQSEGQIYDEVVDCLIARVEAAVSKGRPLSLQLRYAAASVAHY
jgi:hypothetical protein